MRGPRASVLGPVSFARMITDLLTALTLAYACGFLKKLLVLIARFFALVYRAVINCERFIVLGPWSFGTRKKASACLVALCALAHQASRQHNRRCIQTVFYY